MMVINFHTDESVDLQHLQKLYFPSKDNSELAILISYWVGFVQESIL